MASKVAYVCQYCGHEWEDPRGADAPCTCSTAQNVAANTGYWPKLNKVIKHGD